MKNLLFGIREKAKEEKSRKKILKWDPRIFFLCKFERKQKMIKKNWLYKITHLFLILKQNNIFNFIEL